MTDRELDVEVAEKVMGSEVRLASNPEYHLEDPLTPSGDRYSKHGYLAHYSTNISSAWLVVGRLIAMKQQGDFHLEHLNDYGWRVIFCDEDDGDYYPTAARAICEAALEAVKEKPMENEPKHLWLPNGSHVTVNSVLGKSDVTAIQSCPCGEARVSQSRQGYDTFGLGDPDCTLGALFKGFLEAGQVWHITGSEPSFPLTEEIKDSITDGIHKAFNAEEEADE